MKTRPWIDRSELRNPAHPDADEAILAASSLLFELSGQRFGGIWTTTEQYTCESTGAPVGCAYDAGVGGYWNPSIGAYTYVLGRPLGPRRLGPGGDIRLRRRPAQEVISVTVGGVVVDDSQYGLYNRGILRAVGGAAWGLCSGPVVEYTYGSNPPALGRLAARDLAEELLLFFEGGSECSLPDTVTSVARQGLSFTIEDSATQFEKGRLGIYAADLFLSTYNPTKARKRPRVFSPDLPRAYRRNQ